MFQTHRTAIRPATTAHLAQTMTLLSLSVDELKQEIEKELSQNPALELNEERRCPMCHRVLPASGPCPVCSSALNATGDEPIVFISPKEESTYRHENTDNDFDASDLVTATDDLPTYVLRQISPELAVEDRRIAAYILLNLDEDGFLTTSIASIAQYFHVLPSQVLRIQKLIQHADPIGVGSLNTQEALLVQLDALSEIQQIPELAKTIVANHMDQLSKRHMSEIAQALKISLKKVEEIVRFISENLNPFPGRSHWGDHRQPGDSNDLAYHEPDIIISKLNDKKEDTLVVEIMMPISGTLQINPMFKSAIRQADTEKKEIWRGDLERASLFVKCLKQRNNTILRLMKILVNLQKDFIVRGEKHLRPLTRAYFSGQLGVHESTISRAVSGKTAQLPNKKIVPLEKFFDRSLNVRTVLRDLIAQEQQPLSDSELVLLLQKQGYNVARRTVAKYRSMENILPAHLRQPVMKSA